MLNKNQIIAFIDKLRVSRNFEYFSTTHMRMNTLYWASNVMSILNETIQSKQILREVQKSKNLDGGYGGSPGYPSTLLSTFHSLQILKIFKELKYDKKTEEFIVGCVKENCVVNDEFGEKDTRFVCCAVLGLKLLNDAKNDSLNEPDMLEVLKPNFISFILNCFNIDGGFGQMEMAESHAAQIFCCLASLSVLNALDTIDEDAVAQFLIFRQDESGGLSGRPAKKVDCCYSFWNLASLMIMKKDHLIDKEKLKEFIWKCYKEDESVCGFGYRIGEEPDLCHTMFVLAALSLLNYPGLKPVDPIFCL